MRIRLSLALAGLALVPSTGCKKRTDGPTTGSSTAAATSAVDVTADKAAARESWLVSLAKDPQPLVALAGSSEGWRPFFEGEIHAAFEAFEQDARRGSLEARIGLARSALNLAEAYAHLGELQLAVTGRWLDAMSTRPNAKQTDAWRQFLVARLAQREGKAAPKAAPVDGPVGPWMAAAGGEPADLAALLAGQAAGADASVPAGATSSYEARLRVPALVRANRLKEAARALKGLRATEPDFEVEGTALWDPGVAGSLAVYYAAVAAKAVEGEAGWPSLLRAEAQWMMGDAKAAATTLDALLTAKPAAPSLAQLVISGALNADDLRGRAAALQVVVTQQGGDAAQAKALLAKLDASTVARRVQRAWAASFLGEAPKDDVFPADRKVLIDAVADEITALGKSPKGEQDVTQLKLVDRYVDSVQRQHADTLARAGKTAMAVKAWQAAEDKRDAMAPSARNRLPTLAAAARDQVRIGQRRVALKYLSRMASRLPAAGGPAEMLRDLLSLQAMEQGGSATAGQ